MPTLSPRRVLLVAILGSFVAFLDGTISTVALPAIETELGGGLATQQWMVDAYFITLGALILVAGAVSDTFGRILAMRIGLIGFAVTSLAIALAPLVEVLIVARALQGVAGALLVPSSLALITSAFRGAERSRAIGIWTAATTSAMVVGPIVGGVFVDLLSWRWAFVINVVPIALSLVLLFGSRDESVAGRSRRIDVWGAFLAVFGLGGIVFGLIEQQNLGWGSPLIIASLAVGAVAFCAFIVRQRYAAAPLMPLSLFQVRNFWVGNLATAFIYAALALNGFVLPVYLQQVAGLSATLAGMAALPITILMILLSSRVGSLASRIGPRVFMTAGPALMAVGAVLLLTVSPEFSYWTQVLPSVLVFGLGLTLTVTPLTATILGSIEAERSGIGSAVNNAVSRVAGLVVIALLGIIVGGQLDTDGFHRAAIVTAVLLAVGALISFAGIRTAAETPS